MTVGIAALSEIGVDPAVIVSADRMVTVGEESALEYEDTESKIAPVIQSDNLNGVIVGSGPTTYIDEFVRTLCQFIQSADGSETPRTSRGLLNYALSAQQTVVQDTVENQVLSPFGYSRGDLKNDNVNIPSKIQEVIAQQTMEIRNDVTGRVSLLLACVGENGGGIFVISGVDYANFTDTGYAVVGSGADSARLTFMRRNYDNSNDHQHCLFTVLEAKSQSEERQGVGRQMDLVKITQDGVDRFENSEITDLRKQLQEINVRESQARENVINEWDRN